MFPIVISYYTQNTPYEKEIQNLIDSCKKFELETSIDGVDSFGAWELNCAYKPFFILKKLNELKKPILFVDADGIFVGKPSWQEAFSSDLAVRQDPKLPDDHPSKVISSTIYVGNGERARDLVKYWAMQCQKSLLDPKRQEEFWDQIALRDAILENPSKAKISILPLSYAKIFDHPDDCQKVSEPIIEHYQASRRFKNFI